jgi:hypothetical protein
MFSTDRNSDGGPTRKEGLIKDNPAPQWAGRHHERQICPP